MSPSPSPAGKRVSSEVVWSAPVAGYAEARFEDVPFDQADWFEPWIFIDEDGRGVLDGLRVNFGSVSEEARCVGIDERIDGVRYRVLVSGWEVLIFDDSTPERWDYEPWDPIPGTERYGQMCGYDMEQEDYEIDTPIGTYRPYVFMEVIILSTAVAQRSIFAASPSIISSFAIDFDWLAVPNRS